MTVIRAGTCIQIKSTANHQWHPYFVITEPDGNPLEVVVVNLTAYKEGIDDSAVFDVGDHPIIAKKSMINFFDARIAAVERLKAHIDQNPYRLKECCSDGMLEKIRKGFKISRAVKKGLKRYCEDKF